MQDSAFQNAPHSWMRFELLEAFMRIDARVEIIQTDHETYRDAAFGHVVNESAPELFVSQRPAHRMDDAASGVLLFGNVPDFFYSDGVYLRIPISIQIEFPDQLFCE